MACWTARDVLHIHTVFRFVMLQLSNLLTDNIRKGEAMAVEPAFEAQEKSPTSSSKQTFRPPTSPTADSNGPTLTRPRSVDLTVFSRTVTPINDVDMDDADFMLSTMKLP